MKKIILIIIITLAVTNGYSQKKGGFRVGLDGGFVPAAGGAGGMLSLEPKFNIKDNMNVGLRIGLVGMARDVQDDGITPSAEISANNSYVGTYDFYFHKAGKSFVPYIGAGFGYYSVANFKVDDTNTDVPDEFSPAVSGMIGGLIRGGFEWGKFRMGLEYNIVPDSDLENLNGDIIGTASNAYVGIHLGFFLGGGKWGK